MAIDDNTTYGLTGAQVKDLASRISDANPIKKVVIPSDSTTGFALKDVQPGEIYQISKEGGMSFPVSWGGSATGSYITVREGSIATIVVSSVYNGTVNCYMFCRYYSFNTNYFLARVQSTSTITYCYKVIDSASVIDSLTTNTSDTTVRPALSANQGRFLNQRILGNPSSSNVTTVLPWASIGTGSSYTKRALQTTLNISETGLTIPADTWTSLGITMPADFRPTITILGSVTANNSGVFEPGLIRVNTDGTVEVHTSNATTDIYGSIVYPVAN